MADELLTLCDSLVTALGSQFPSVTISEVAHTVTTEWKHTPTVQLEDTAIQEPLIWVVDWSETIEGTSQVDYADFGILIVVQMKLPEGATAETATVRALSQLSSDIARYLRPRDGSLELDDAICVRIERKSARNLGDANIRRYYSELLTTWRMY